jgi:hypothetical protein
MIVYKWQTWDEDEDDQNMHKQFMEDWILCLLDRANTQEIRTRADAARRSIGAPNLPKKRRRMSSLKPELPAC